jgi:hypothetical protein
MTDWIERFRASVGWGDEITEGILPDGTPCCWVLMDDGMHAWVSGTLQDLAAAITLAQQALGCLNCSGVTVLLLDQHASDYQVEEACHLLAKAGAGCDFLAAQPRVLRDGLLLRMSEGTILDHLPPTA